MLRSTRETVERLMNYYVTPTTWLQGNRERLMGIKVQSRIIVLYQNLFHLGNCTRPSDLLANGSRGEFYYPTNWCPIKWALWRKPLRQFYPKGTRKKTSPLFYSGGVQQNTYFYSLWILCRMWSNWLHENYRGLRALMVRNWKLYMGGF